MTESRRAASCSPEMRERAVRMVLDNAGEHGTRGRRSARSRRRSAARQRPARRRRGVLLRPDGGTRPRGATHTEQPPANPAWCKALRTGRVESDPIDHDVGPQASDPRARSPGLLLGRAVERVLPIPAIQRSPPPFPRSFKRPFTPRRSTGPIDGPGSADEVERGQWAGVPALGRRPKRGPRIPVGGHRDGLQRSRCVAGVPAPGSTRPAAGKATVPRPTAAPGCGAASKPTGVAARKA